MAETASELMKITTIKEAIESKEINNAISRGIFRITRLRRPPSRMNDAGASRDRLDWQDLYGEIVRKLSDPSVGFAATNFDPAFAFGVARNTAGEWLRERMKERPRRRRKPVAEQEDETVTFQAVQFDPSFRPKPQDPETMLNTTAIKAWDDFLDSLAYDFAELVLECFAEECPEDHSWLIDYMATRRIRKHTAADHQRAARLCKKLRELYVEMEQGLEDDAEEAELEYGDQELEAA